MKILQTTPIHLSQVKNQPINQQNSLRCGYPNFKGAEKAAKPFIEPDNLQKIIAMATAAATAAVTATLTTILGQKDEDKAITSDLTTEADNLEVIRKLTEQNKKYEEIIEGLNARIKVLEDKQQDKQNTQTPTADANDVKQFVFPKKRGRLSKAQEALKLQMEKMSFSAEINQQATEICQNILNNKSLIVSENETDSNVFADTLAKQLNNAASKEEKEGIIRTAYNAIFASNASNNQTDPASDKKTADVLESTAQGGQNTTTDGARRRRPRINETRSSADENSALKQKGKNEEIYTYVRGGTPSPNLVDNLTHILKSFEKTKISEFKAQHANETEEKFQADFKKLKWMSAVPVGRVTDTIVLQEVNRIKEENFKNHLPDENVHDIKFITQSNAAEVANAINEDERFSYFFTTHGAIRFVDRFVNFDSDIPVSEQASYALDKLEKIVKIAIKEGVDIQTYPKNKPRKFCSPRIVISPEHFDKEALKIFGTTPLIIGICENQPDSNYYNKQFKQAIIHTIFPV